MIKLKCIKCNYSFEVSEKEFKEYPELYIDCFVKCGGRNILINLEEVTGTIIEEQIRNNINKWFNELGIEGTLELIERHDNDAIRLLYEQELRKRGLLK